MDAADAPLICGVDEAGRGALAGPILAAAVILNPRDPIEGLKDSKKLSASQRERLSVEIVRRAYCYGVGWATVREIDDRGIEWANRTVLTRAVHNLLAHLPKNKQNEVEVKIDGNRPALGLSLRQTTIVRGDETVPEISAAGIIAKVVRDRYMVERLHKSFPEYGFDKHKGYATRVHVETLYELGPTSQHRSTFKVKQQWGAADQAT